MSLSATGVRTALDGLHQILIDTYCDVVSIRVIIAEERGVVADILTHNGPSPCSPRGGESCHCGESCILGEIICYLIYCGVANIMDGVVVLLLKEIDLEGEDGEELIDIALDVLNAPLFPRPELRSYVIIDGADAVLVNVFGYLQVEAGVIDENHHVGLPFSYVALALFQTTQDGSRMEQYGDKTHVCEVTVVADKGAAYGLHLVASEETELGLGVFTSKCCHQV